MAIINNKSYPLTAAESKELDRIKNANLVSADYAQRSADVWMRSATNGAASSRRKAAVKALGLSDEIKFL